MPLDVFILGAGIAGCALAIHLRRLGVSVLLAGRTPLARAVGEHLPPQARPLLQELGVWEQVTADGHLPCPGVRSAWGSAQLFAQDYLFTPYGEGWNLDRKRFDQRLLAAAQQAGATVLPDAALGGLQRTPQGWQVELLSAGVRSAHSCRVLVDATGRASALARRLGSRRLAQDHLVGAATWLAAPSHATQRDHTLLVEATANGWWYATPLPGQSMVAVWLTDPPLATQPGSDVQILWRDQLAQTVHIRRRLAGYEVTGATLVRPANTYCMDPLAGEDWFAVGDAAAALDPLSSMGIYRALMSARWAAEAVQRHLDGDGAALTGYAETVRREFENQLAQRAWFYRQEERWAEQPFWRARHADLAVRRPEDHAADGDGRGIERVGRAGSIARRLSAQRPHDPLQ